MTSPSNGPDSEPAAQRDAIRRRLIDAAHAIACTEDNVADIFDRMALTLPHYAARLRHLAAHARAHAAEERRKAGMFGHTST